MALLPSILVFAGTRPQLIKCAALFNAWKKLYKDSCSLSWVHTGQHYDTNMSEVFLDELDLPPPLAHFTLDKSMDAMGQMAQMMHASFSWLNSHKPSIVLVFGDTNTTLAAALAAARVGIPVAHVEAGLRSGDFAMPEEQNRILTDRLSRWLFVSSEQELIQLNREGVPQESGNLKPEIHVTGDIMADLCLTWQKKKNQRRAVLDSFNLREGDYLLATLHRDFNTTTRHSILNHFQSLQNLAAHMRMRMLVFVHPRVAKLVPMDDKALQDFSSLNFSSPASYGTMQHLLAGCRALCTDSGGLQKEGAWHQKPVIVLRPSTEWKALVEHAFCWVNGAGALRVEPALEFIQNFRSTDFPPFYGEGESAVQILRHLLRIEIQ